jgi:hypothetical protein
MVSTNKFPSDDIRASDIALNPLDGAVSYVHHQPNHDI